MNHLARPGFEWRDPVYPAGTVYASCQRRGMDGEWPYPHYGQFGLTLPLALCGATLRARAALTKAEAAMPSRKKKATPTEEAA
jgi:hypothetical protein